MPGTVQLHRVIKATPEKVYRAFTDPKAMEAWLPPYGFLCTVHHMDVKAGGTFKMSFTNFTTDKSHSFGGEYLEVKANAYIKYTDRFDDRDLPGEMITTIELSEVIGGTAIKATQAGIPDVIPESMCYLGWQESMDKLIRLVEPEIPDAG